MEVSFFVAGEPKAQPRAKAARIGGFIRIYTPNTAKVWKEAVAAAARKALGKRWAKLEGPLSLNLAFSMPRPQAHYLKAGLRPDAPTHHTKKPDVDNLAKAVMDALTDCGVWVDDDQIASLSVTKFYVSRDPNVAGCLVTIKPA